MQGGRNQTGPPTKRGLDCLSSEREPSSRQVCGAYSDLQDFYRRGLASLDAYCRKTYNYNKSFRGARCCATVSPTRSTSATRTSQVGCLLASPARKRCFRRRICKAKMHFDCDRKQPIEGNHHQWSHKDRIAQ
jgi:hypothetical protein